MDRQGRRGRLYGAPAAVAAPVGQSCEIHSLSLDPDVGLNAPTKSKHSLPPDRRIITRRDSTLRTVSFFKKKTCFSLHRSYLDPPLPSPTPHDGKLSEDFPAIFCVSPRGPRRSSRERGSAWQGKGERMAGAGNAGLPRLTWEMGAHVQRRSPGACTSRRRRICRCIPPVASVKGMSSSQASGGVSIFNLCGE